MKASREEFLFDVFERQLPAHYQSKVVRASQVQMALDIAAFLHRAQRDSRILFIQAPVGTGKSLGALVPALMETQYEKSFEQNRVVYATATINLQGQLMQSEVPLLKQIGVLEEAILAKGKAHYYCHKELQHARGFSSDIKQKLTAFHKSTVTGHRNDFESEHGEIDNHLWEQVSFQKVNRRDCESCGFNGACGTRMHRSRFLDEANQLVVTNHDQLIESVLRYLQDPPQPPIVPINPGIIIIDEAHHFQENFLSRLQVSYTIRDLRAIGTNNRFPRRLKKAYLDLVENLERKVRTEATNVESLQGRYPLPPTVPVILYSLEKKLTEAIDELATKEATKFTLRFDREDEFLSRLEQTSSGIRNIINEKEFASWITYEDESFAYIGRKFPTDFRRVLEFLSQRNKVIVMSGTLVANDDFTTLLNQWRLPISRVQTRIIPESFQYKQQALIYVPDDALDPNDPMPAIIRIQTKQIERLLTLTHGRTLLLSTSKKYMEEIHPSLAAICSTLRVSLYRQEQAGVELLTKQFKNDETSVLLGSGSFFSGFSVPGTSLVSVIFNRLPFPVPDDPYLALIGEGLEEEFFDEVSLPHMMVKLNQGAGRLIRDISDYGIVTILDPRVFNLKYGQKIREDFERKGYRFTRSFEEVRNFYDAKLKCGSEAEYIPYDRNQLSVSDLLKEFGYGAAAADSSKEKPKVNVRPKVTEEQRKLAVKVFTENGMPYPKKGVTYSEDLFRALVDIYYQTYRDPAYVKEHFPYKDEAQKEEFSIYNGTGTRTYKMKHCTLDSFGCDGVCSNAEKRRITELITSVGGTVDGFTPGRGFCWVSISPRERNDQIIEMCSAKRQAAPHREDR